MINSIGEGMKPSTGWPCSARMASEVAIRASSAGNCARTHTFHVTRLHGGECRGNRVRADDHLILQASRRASRLDDAERHGVIRGIQADEIRVRLQNVRRRIERSLLVPVRGLAGHDLEIPGRLDRLLETFLAIEPRLVPGLSLR